MSLTKYSVTYKPFLYPEFVEIAKKHEMIHWVEDEADLQGDISCWKSGMSEGEKNLVTNILKLFTQSDVAVGNTYHKLIIPRIKNNEARNMLSCFAARETIHQRAYALLNETLGIPDDEYNAFLEYKDMADKWEYMVATGATSNTNQDLAFNLAKLACMEGISLFASFIMLKNFERFGKMRGMCEVVEWSVRDETVHVEGNMKLFRSFCGEHKDIVTDEFKSNLYQMVRDLVDLEDKFIDVAFEMGPVQGLDGSEVKDYIRYIADRRLIQLGLKPNYGVDKNPLPWVEWVLNDNIKHSNFFEGRVTNYGVVGMSGKWEDCYA